MERRNRLRKTKLIQGETQPGNSGVADTGWIRRRLAAARGCEEAHEAQVQILLIVRDYQPVECPHCHRTPERKELLALRPSCPTAGHPEQDALKALYGRPYTPCPACGETPGETRI